jgi:hypothetical protein
MGDGKRRGTRETRTVVLLKICCGFLDRGLEEDSGVRLYPHYPSVCDLLVSLAFSFFLVAT